MKTKKAKKNNKKSPEEILSEARKIDTELVSNEVLDWLIKNVEYYIDNQTKEFKIDIIIDGESDPPMPETRKLQNLFRQIPDDSDVIKLSDIKSRNLFDDLSSGNIDIEAGDKFDGIIRLKDQLDEISIECLNKIRENHAKREKLFERLSYFYEMMGVYKGEALLRQLNGAVEINKFEYEQFSVDVKVEAPAFQVQNAEGETTNIQLDSKSYTIPEGFTIWLEIAFTTNSKATSIF